MRDTDKRWSTMDFFKLMAKDRYLINVAPGEEKEGDIIVVRFGVTEELPNGTSGHLFVVTRDGWLSLTRNISLKKDGIMLEEPMSYTDHDKKYAILRPLPARIFIDFLHKRFADIYNDGVKPLFESLKNLVASGLPRLKESLPSKINTEIRLATEWVHALRTNPDYKDQRELIPFGYAFYTNKFLEYLLIARELCKGRFLEDIHANKKSSYDLKIVERITVEGHELTEKIEWTVCSPNFEDSSPAIPHYGSESCLGTPLISAMAILVCLGGNGSVEKRIPAILYPMPLGLVVDSLAQDPRFQQVNKSDFYRKETNSFLLPHGGFVFGGPGETVAHIKVAEEKGGFPPHDCTSFVTAAMP